MRTIGDLRWLNDYIGIPYAFGGREFNALDCYGLCKLVYRNEFGILLPDWVIDETDLVTLDNLITGQLASGAWTPLDEPWEGCFVICSTSSAAHHMGLYFGGGVLHTVRGFSSTYQPMSRFKTSFKNIVFGDWKP